MYRLEPIVDYNCNPPHTDGFEVFVENDRIGIFWVPPEDGIKMLDKLNNKPSDFDVKLMLEPLSKDNHFFILERGCSKVLWGELFVDFDTAVNILGKLND